MEPVRLLIILLILVIHHIAQKTCILAATCTSAEPAVQMRWMIMKRYLDTKHWGQRYI